MSPKEEKIVYFVRHGESESNTLPVFQAIDSPLTAGGRVQAELIAERMTRIPFDTLISSPLPRTKDTAEAIAKATQITPEYSDLFIERIKPTGLAGKQYTDPEAQVLWKQWEESLWTPGLRAGDGENFDDLMARADKALGYLHNREEQSLVVVTHGYFLRTILARVLLGDSLTGEAFRAFQSRIESANTGLSALKYGKRWDGSAWYLWIYNDHAHLG